MSTMKAAVYTPEDVRLKDVPLPANALCAAS
jgi:hypothetical protein